MSGCHQDEQVTKDFPKCIFILCMSGSFFLLTFGEVLPAGGLLGPEDPVRLLLWNPSLAPKGREGADHCSLHGS